MCWQDAWQTSVIGIRSLQIGMFNFLSTQTCWFLSCVNSENYDFWCVFIAHPSWSFVKNLSRRLRNTSEQWPCCNWHQQVRPAIHFKKKKVPIFNYIHYMSNGLNLLHPRKDVAEMVIVFCVSLIVPEDLMFAIKSGEHVYQESSFFVSPLSFLRVSWWYQVSMSWCNCSKMSEVLAGAQRISY